MRWSSVVVTYSFATLSPFSRPVTSSPPTTARIRSEVWCQLPISGRSSDGTCLWLSTASIRMASGQGPTRLTRTEAPDRQADASPSFQYGRA